MNELEEKIREIFSITKERFRRKKRRQPITLSDIYLLLNFTRDDVLALQKDHEQKLEKQLNRLEAPRAGSIFTVDMEFGMRYILKQQLGQSVTAMIKEAEQHRKRLVKQHKIMLELKELLKKRPRPPPYDLDSPYSRTWMKKYREYCDNIEEKMEELTK